MRIGRDERGGAALLRMSACIRVWRTRSSFRRWGIVSKGRISHGMTRSVTGGLGFKGSRKWVLGGSDWRPSSVGSRFH